MEICRDFPVNDGNIHISGFPDVMEKLIVRLANHDPDQSVKPSTTNTSNDLNKFSFLHPFWIMRQCDDRVDLASNS